MTNMWLQLNSKIGVKIHASPDKIQRNSFKPSSPGWNTAVVSGLQLVQNKSQLATEQFSVWLLKYLEMPKWFRAETHLWYAWYLQTQQFLDLQQLMVPVVRTKHCETAFSCSQMNQTSWSYLPQL